MGDIEQTWIIFLIIFFLILVNGFFAAAEMALVSIRKKDIQKMVDKKVKKANILKKVTADSTVYLSTIQVAITLAGFLSSAFAGAKLSSSVVALFEGIGLRVGPSLAVVLVTVVLSYITLVLGELVPKRIALQNSKKFALFSVRVVYAVMIITKPFVKLLSISTNAVLKVLRIPEKTEKERITEEEIKEMIVSGHFEGLYKKEEREMLESIFRFDDLPAEMIMTPRVEVFLLDIKQSFVDQLKEVIESGFSRIPVYKENKDQIVGVLLLKDVLMQVKEVGFEGLKIEDLLREPYFVPEHVKLNTLFHNMKKQKEHISLLVDEYGGFQGIVTMEDLIEEIVGNIYDEHDDQDESIVRQNQHSYLVDGTMQLQELNRRLHLHLPEDASEYDTLGGLIINQLGYIPKEVKDEEVFYHNLVLKIVKIEDNRIEKVQLLIKDNNTK
jgi:putative hemolysin